MPLASIEIKGKNKSYAINWYTTDKEIETMREDGIEVYTIENVIPGWIVSSGLTSPFIFFQDIWNFKNPFRK